MKLKRKFIGLLAAGTLSMTSLGVLAGCSCGGQKPGPEPSKYEAPEIIVSQTSYVTAAGEINLDINASFTLSRNLYDGETPHSVTINTQPGSTIVVGTSDVAPGSLQIKENRNVVFTIKLPLSAEQMFQNNIVAKFKVGFLFDYEGQTKSSQLIGEEPIITINYNSLEKNYVTFNGQQEITQSVKLETTQGGQTEYEFGANQKFELSSKLIQTSSINETLRVTIPGANNRISFTNPDNPYHIEDDTNIILSSISFTPATPTTDEWYEFQIQFELLVDGQTISTSKFPFIYNYHHAWQNITVTWTGTDESASFKPKHNSEVIIGNSTNGRLELSPSLGEDDKISKVEIEFISNKNAVSLVIKENDVETFWDDGHQYVKIPVYLSTPEVMDEPIKFQLEFYFKDAFGVEHEPYKTTQVFSYQYTEPPLSITVGNISLEDGETVTDQISAELPEEVTATTVSSYNVKFDQPNVSTRNQELIVRSKPTIQNKTIYFRLVVGPSNFYADETFNNCIVTFRVGTFWVASNPFTISFKHAKDDFTQENLEDYCADRSFSVTAASTETTQIIGDNLQDGWILSRAAPEQGTPADEENFNYYFVTTWRFKEICDNVLYSHPTTAYIGFSDIEHATKEIDDTRRPGYVPYCCLQDYWKIPLDGSSDDFRWEANFQKQSNWYINDETSDQKNEFDPKNGTANYYVSKVNFASSIKTLTESSPYKGLALKNKLRKLNDWTLQAGSKKSSEEVYGHINNLADSFANLESTDYEDGWFQIDGYTKYERPEGGWYATYYADQDEIQRKTDDQQVLISVTDNDDYYDSSLARAGWAPYQGKYNPQTYEPKPEDLKLAQIGNTGAYHRCPIYTYGHHWGIESYEHWPFVGTFGSMLALEHNNGGIPKNQVLGIMSYALPANWIQSYTDWSNQYYVPIWESFVDNQIKTWNILAPYDVSFA